MRRARYLPATAPQSGSSKHLRRGDRRQPLRRLRLAAAAAALDTCVHATRQIIHPQCCVVEQL
jgi:hypothetical protein